MKEFNLPLWLAAVDFKKAFDTVSHQSLWQALEEQHVPNIYVSMLRRLYCGQKAQVQCDVMSRSFYIQRGTKQGDPISPVLFNAVLEKVMRLLKDKWRREGKGIKVGSAADDFLQNLRCADDLSILGVIKGTCGKYA